MNWKKGRGKLGFFTPLLGDWKCNEGSTDRENPECIRSFEKMLHGSYIQLTAIWNLGDKTYIDHTLFGVNSNKDICFWSFTSDGKQAQGQLTDVTDIHPEAFGFEAQMPAGVARQIYWPDDNDGFYWAVESKTKKGWNRFVLQHYKKQ